jgi:hypothetical protein
MVAVAMVTKVHKMLNETYVTIISTCTAHALIVTIITLDKNIIDYLMKY